MEKTFKISGATPPNKLNMQNAYWYINGDLFTITYHTNRESIRHFSCPFVVMALESMLNQAPMTFNSRVTKIWNYQLKI